MNVRQTINAARARLVAAGIENGEAGRDANLLARHLLGWDRPMLMTNVVASLGRVQQNIGALDVLSIGPRSEIEIFGLIGAGFSAVSINNFARPGRDARSSSWNSPLSVSKIFAEFPDKI